MSYEDFSFRCIRKTHPRDATEPNAMRRTAQFSRFKVPCLIRHRGGRCYASAKVGGKIIRRWLDTDDYNTAPNWLPPVLAEMRGARNAAAAGTLGGTA